MNLGVSVTIDGELIKGVMKSWNRLPRDRCSLTMRSRLKLHLTLKGDWLSLWIKLLAQLRSRKDIWIMTSIITSMTFKNLIRYALPLVELIITLIEWQIVGLHVTQRSTLTEARITIPLLRVLLVFELILILTESVLLLQLKASYALILIIALVVLLRWILELVIHRHLWLLQLPIRPSKCTSSIWNPERSILRPMRMCAVTAIRLKFKVLFLIFNSYRKRICLIESGFLTPNRLALSEYMLFALVISLLRT